MFELLKKKLFDMDHESQKELYRVKYIPICNMVNATKCEFQIADMDEAYVLANGIVDAGVEFAKHNVLSPHVCIFKISRCGKGLNPKSILN